MKIYSRTRRKMLYSLTAMAVSMAGRRALGLAPAISQAATPAETLPLKEIAAVLKQAKWTGWAMNEEEREDGSKQGLTVIQPAFQALKEAFPV